MELLSGEAARQPGENKNRELAKVKSLRSKLVCSSDGRNGRLTQLGLKQVRAKPKGRHHLAWRHSHTFSHG